MELRVTEKFEDRTNLTLNIKRTLHSQQTPYEAAFH
jgi:hypothetical protein